MKGKLEREEIIAIVGGALLALGVFLTWYKLGNPNTHIGSFTYQDDRSVSAWQALEVMRWLFLAAALAPVILAYIVVRGHALSWPRGELTAVVAITAVTLVFLRGLIIKPGEPVSQISLGIGWYVALAGSVIMLGGAVSHRARQDVGPRKPPGVL
jgi:hypothetical protein